MQRQDALDILERISELDIVRTCVSLRYGASITIDTLLRFEETYMVIRGREAGTNDDCRAFFVPYEEVIFIKIDRVIVPSEVRVMFGEAPDLPAKVQNDVKTDVSNESKPTTTTPPPQAMDPAGIAKQNLLARIRAARTAVGANSS